MKTTPSSPAPRALVYRDLRTHELSEPVAELLGRSKHGFDVQFVGPDEPLKLTGSTLEGATLLAQPGGTGSVEKAYAREKSAAGDIRTFVRSGGRYLGFCMGGYLAGRGPGFKLLPGDSDGYVGSPGATVPDDRDTLVRVDWGEGKDLQRRWMYFQDGPYFNVREDDPGVQVLARYTNGEVAAVAAPYGDGRVTVIGPHPEAPPSWFSDYGLPYVDCTDLGEQLIDAAMRPGSTG